MRESEGVQEKVVAEGSKQSAAKRIKEGRISIYSSYNNTIMALADGRGNVLTQVSAGKIGFSGSKKSTPFAASKVAEAIAQAAGTKGIELVEIFVKGVGPGRDSALRSLASRPFDIAAIHDVTPVPHNGPRPPKIRRV